HTLEGILETAKEGAEIAVMGPTAGIVPEPLFERGVRVVGGVWVRDADGLLDLLSAGGSGYHFFDSLADRIVIERPV
ncbi:MAG: Fis family transcriptional regulator, partial [Proteobacteria bacterium]|nr:Fis family transcriptional regulator [Pseudomonadota bacterium]